VLFFFFHPGKGWAVMLAIVIAMETRAALVVVVMESFVLC